MLAALSVEIRKLNRSLALLLAIVAPLLIAIFTFFNVLRLEGAQTWYLWMTNGNAIWAFFMLPMSVTALTALVAQMEHAPKSWDHLRALPLPRWKIYAAKTLCVLGIVAFMSALVLLTTIGAVYAAVAVQPALAPTGALNFGAHALVSAKMLAAALLLIALQLWMAMRFASFVPALALGIGGTFFSVVATSADAGVFMPWQMPVNMLATESWRVETALGLGAVGGAIALMAMIAHLSAREVR
jgi:ABC-2 type transport system permease protein